MKKKILFGFVFVGFWVVFFLFVEGVFRLAGVGYSTEPFERVSGTPYYRDNPDFLNKYYPGRTTPRAEGKFKNLFLASKPTNGLRIFVVGGSTAQGWPFEPNQSFSGMIGAALQVALPNRHVEVINVGFSAMSSYYVADVVKKLFRHHPDLILVYTGQNEYYGTISITTGGGYHTKWWYLGLREWRLFQVLFGLFERAHQPSDTMMAAQFAGTRVYFDERMDAEVANHFARNLRRLIAACEARGVPLAVYDIAANLIHMPPFRSVGQDEVTPLILSNDFLFRRETWRSDQTKHLLAQWIQQYPSNAHVLYIDGLARRARGEDFMPSLVLAKDMDAIPFRYRETVRNALLGVVTSAEGAVLLPLQEEIVQRFGYEGFGRALFIDHLHFNYAGQKLLAKTAILHAPLGISSEERERALSFLFEGTRGVVSEEETVWRDALVHGTALDRGIWFTFYDEFMAIQNILTLTSQSPYREMVIPFPRDPQWQRIKMFRHPVYREIFEAYQKQTNAPLPFGNFFLAQLAERNKWEAVEVLLQAYRHNNPGLGVSYQNLAEFYASRGLFEDALGYYGMAYLLSEGQQRRVLAMRGRDLARHMGDEKLWGKRLQWLEKNAWNMYDMVP